MLFGFNKSVNSILNLIVAYKQKLQNTNDRTLSSVSLSYPGVMSQAKNVASSTQSLDSNQNLETGKFKNKKKKLTKYLLNLKATLVYMQHSYKLNEAIGKQISMLLQIDRFEAKCGSIQQCQNVQQNILLIRILTLIGEFYLRHDKLIDAEMCCQEIAALNSMSYLYLYLKGRIHEYKQEIGQAKIHYQNALSINPYHIPSLQQLSIVLCLMEDFHLAEKMIRDAISLNNSLPDSWHILARVLEYLDDSQSALKCYQTCLQLEATNPIIPFTTLTRIL